MTRSFGATVVANVYFLAIACQKVNVSQMIRSSGATPHSACVPVTPNHPVIRQLSRGCFSGCTSSTEQHSVDSASAPNSWSQTAEPQLLPRDPTLQCIHGQEMDRCQAADFAAGLSSLHEERRQQCIRGRRRYGSFRLKWFNHLPSKEPRSAFEYPNS